MPARRSFINPSSAPPDEADRQWRNFRDVCLFGLAFVSITTAAALVYFLGSGVGWGIKPTFTPADQIGFLDCLHFSFVTITTLGYGDYRPEYYGRLVADAEVVVGIVLMGILISRLVSRQQDRLTKRLVRGLLNSEIQDFRDLLAGVRTDFVGLPVLAAPYSQDVVRASALNKAAGLARAMARYWRYEARQPDLAEIIPLRAVSRMLGEILEIITLVDGDIAGQQPHQLGEENRKHVRNLTESFLAVSNVLETRVDDHGIQHSAEQIAALVLALRDKFELKKLWL